MVEILPVEVQLHNNNIHLLHAQANLVTLEVILQLHEVTVITTDVIQLEKGLPNLHLLGVDLHLRLSEFIVQFFGCVTSIVSEQILYYGQTDIEVDLLLEVELHSGLTALLHQISRELEGVGNAQVEWETS